MGILQDIYLHHTSWQWHEKHFVKPTLLCVSTSEYQIYLNAIKGVTVSFAETSILIVWKRAVLYSFHCRLYYAEFKGNTC